jgi:hypothetical protein
MKNITLTVIVALFVSNLSACTNDQGNCSGSGGLTFVCGPENAEDLVRIPQTRWIISSAMGAEGGLYLIDSEQKTWRQFYSEDPLRVRQDMATYDACPGAPTQENFITHGLSIRAGKNGHSTLYVVGHGGREAIEVFDVDASEADPKLTWIGCVLMPEGLAANSVASFRDGSLVATVLMYPGTSFDDMFAGRPTGAVYEWSTGDSGFELVRGTELPGNNGIEVSPDEREIFVASTGLRTLVVYSRSNPSSVLRSTRVLEFVPDNVHLADDGGLITAGLKSEEEGCVGLGDENLTIEKFASCPRGFIAAKIDPNTMEDTTLTEKQANSSFSNATMALEVGEEVWFGTFSGDRIGVATN